MVVVAVWIATTAGCQATNEQPAVSAPVTAPASVNAPTPAGMGSRLVTAEPTTLLPIALTPDAMEAKYQAALPLFDYERQSPLDLEEGAVTEASGVLTQEISYSSSTGQRVPGVLVAPRRREGLPGVIWLGPSPAVVDRAQAIAQLGAIVISIDPPQVRRTGEMSLTFDDRDREEMIELMIELRRAVDLLVASGADPNRIAFIGFSWGGAMGAALSGIEHRIGSFVLMFADGGNVEHLLETPDRSFGATLSGAEREHWLVAMEPLESLYFVRHAAPSWLFFQNGLHDESIAEVSATRLHEAATEPKLVRWYDSGHDPTPDAPEVWCDQAQWLKDRLELSSSSVVECGQV